MRSMLAESALVTAAVRRDVQLYTTEDCVTVC